MITMSNNTQPAFGNGNRSAWMHPKSPRISLIPPVTCLDYISTIQDLKDFLQYDDQMVFVFLQWK
jgi:hypothetical protein